MKYSVEKKLFIYICTAFSWRKCGRTYHRKDYDSAVMRKEFTYNIVTKFHSTGLMMDRKKSRKRHVLTEEKLK